MTKYSLLYLIFIATSLYCSSEIAMWKKLTQQGLDLFSQNNLDKAYAQFNDLKFLYPECPQIYCNLGIIATQLGKFPEAVKSLQEAIAFKPDYTKAHHYLALALEEQDLLKPSLSSLDPLPPTPTPQNTGLITAEISVGELIDKITILDIKQKKITDKGKLRNINTERTALEKKKQTIRSSRELENLTKKLHATNEKLWELEDKVREKERKKEFDQEFIDLARSIYFTNDERYTYKQKINNLCNSRIIEEKSYTRYAAEAI